MLHRQQELGSLIHHLLHHQQELHQHQVFQVVQRQRQSLAQTRVRNVIEGCEFAPQQKRTSWYHKFLHHQLVLPRRLLIL